MTPDPPGDAPVDVDAIAKAVAACPSVVRLSAGVFGEVATHLPGHRVTGVRVIEGAVEVHVVGRWVPFLPQVADEVRAVVAPLVGSRLINVFIDDLSTGDDDPEDHDSDALPAGSGL